MKFDMGWSSGCLAVIGFTLIAAGGAAAHGQELRNPRLQKSLQQVEVARGDIEEAEQRLPPDLHEEAHGIAHELDEASRELTDILGAMGTRRQIEPGHAQPTDRPARAAAESMRRALDELTRGVADQDLHGRVRAAADHERAALAHAEHLAHREEAVMAAAPAVVELRHPHVQRAIQMLEAARAQLDAARRNASGDILDRESRISQEIDDALREASASLASAGVARTIEPARIESTDHPLRAAHEALQHAAGELEGVKTDEFQGHARQALERARVARDDLAGLVSGEVRT